MIEGHERLALTLTSDLPVARPDVLRPQTNRLCPRSAYDLLPVLSYMAYRHASPLADLADMSVPHLSVLPSLSMCPSYTEPFSLSQERVVLDITFVAD